MKKLIFILLLFWLAFPNIAFSYTADDVVCGEIIHNVKWVSGTSQWTNPYWSWSLDGNYQYALYYYNTSGRYAASSYFTGDYASCVKYTDESTYCYTTTTIQRSPTNPISGGTNGPSGSDDALTTAIKSVEVYLDTDYAGIQSARAAFDCDPVSDGDTFHPATNFLMH